MTAQIMIPPNAVRVNRAARFALPLHRRRAIMSKEKRSEREKRIERTAKAINKLGPEYHGMFTLLAHALAKGRPEYKTLRLNTPWEPKGCAIWDQEGNLVGVATAEEAARLMATGPRLAAGLGILLDCHLNPGCDLRYIENAVSRFWETCQEALEQAGVRAAVAGCRP